MSMNDLLLLRALRLLLAKFVRICQEVHIKSLFNREQELFE